MMITPLNYSYFYLFHFLNLFLYLFFLGCSFYLEEFFFLFANQKLRGGRVPYYSNVPWALSMIMETPNMRRAREELIPRRVLQNSYEDKAQVCIFLYASNL